MNPNGTPGKYGFVIILLPTSMRFLFLGHPANELIIWALIIVTALSALISLALVARFFINLIIYERK